MGGLLPSIPRPPPPVAIPPQATPRTMVEDAPVEDAPVEDAPVEDDLNAPPPPIAMRTPAYTSSPNPFGVCLEYVDKPRCDSEDGYVERAAAATQTGPFVCALKHFKLMEWQYMGEQNSCSATDVY